MQYWWVSQRNNYESAIEEGNLWTIQNRDGSWVWHRRPILQLATGDLIVHHAHTEVRAVSRVVKPAVPASRPASYPNPGGDRDDGFLVEVQVIRKNLRLTKEQFRQVIPFGRGIDGPLTKKGYSKQAYLQPLARDLALRLLAAAGVSASELDADAPAPYGWSAEAGATDALEFANMRLEQRQLRKYLLSSRESGRCDLCGRVFPADLLVTAHIRPRRDLSDSERLEFDRVAMLACLAGCDALFEAGYIVVDERGNVAEGRAAATPDLAALVGSLLGRPCTRHNDRTAGHFAARRGRAFVASSFQRTNWSGSEAQRPWW